MLAFLGIAAGLRFGGDAPDRPNKEAFEGVTVCVLPFETVGPSPQAEQLGRGIGSEVRAALSRLPGLRLIRASGEKAPAAARYIVSGTVHREGESLIVNARLVDTRTSERLWRGRFEQPSGGLLAVREEIGLAVAAHLPRRASDADREHLAERPTWSAEAYEHFVRGQALLPVRDAEDSREARARFARALDLDPRFARAWAALAVTYAMEYRAGAAPRRGTPLERALELAHAARDIDPAVAEAHWTIGFAQAQDRRHELALESLQRALELNPSYADAYALMGAIYTFVGEPARAIPLLRTALRLNPEGGALYHLALARAHFFLEDVEQALINLQEAHARDPEDVETRVFLAAALAAHGERDEASWEAERLRAQHPGFTARAWLEGHPLRSERHRQRLLEQLAKAGL